MDSIASRANVSKRTLYKYFANKKALLDEILFHLISKNQKAIRIFYNEEIPFPDQVKDLIHQKCQHLLGPDNLKLAKIILSEVIKSDCFIKKEEIEEILKAESNSLTWIKEAQKAGKLSSKLSEVEILEQLNTIVNGFVFFPLVMGKKESYTHQDVTIISDIFLQLNSVDFHSPIKQ